MADKEYSTGKIYLGDWLYNAGIVGFIKIISEGDKEKIADFVKINDNSIEFDRAILEGFSQKFFKAAFNAYGRYDRLVKDLNDYIAELEGFSNDLSKDELEKITKKYDSIKKRLNFVLIKAKLKEKTIALPDKKIVSENPKELLLVLKEVLKLLEADYEDFLESDTKSYVADFLVGKEAGKKKGNIRKKLNCNSFKQNFEDPIINNTNQLEVKGKEKNKIEYQCTNCERVAKKDVFADTRIGNIAGLNKDAINQLWDFNSKLYLCEICELIYFCTFAGFTDIPQGKEKVYYFINNDNNVNELINDNRLLQQVLNKDQKSNIVLDYFTEYFLEAEKGKSQTILKNVSFIELDNTNSIMPKVFSLNVSKSKAIFIENYSESFEKLAKASYKFENTSRYLLKEIIKEFIFDSLNYNQIYTLFKIYIASKEKRSNYYNAYFNTIHIQHYTLIIALYKTNIGGNSMNENAIDETKDSIWRIRGQGKGLAEKLREDNKKNKIQTIVFRLLTALREGDVNRFMEIITRVYMAYGLFIPYAFVDGIIKKDNFYAYGYSFVNGLLAKEFNKEDNKKEDNKKEASNE